MLSCRQRQGTMLSCRQRLSTASMHLLDMVKDYITRTRASIKGAVRKARGTAGRALVPGRLIYLLLSY
jgi:hypothetical protein